MLIFRIFYRQFTHGRKLEAAEVEAESREKAENQILYDNPFAQIVGGFFCWEKPRERGTYK